MVPLLLKLKPAEYNTYVEPFAGGLSFFAALDPARVEVVNDLDHNVTNFYEVLRGDDRERLLDALAVTPFSRKDLNEAIKNLSATCDPFTRAWSWFVAVQFSYLKKMGGGYAWAHRSNQPQRYRNVISRLPAFAHRLLDAHIECDTALRIIERYDEKGTFFFLDPPYPQTDQGQYGGYTQADLEQLVKRLTTVDAQFLLCCYALTKKSEASRDRAERIEVVWRKVHAESQGRLF